MQSIELTNKTEKEIEEIKESVPDGHEEKRGDKMYWMFENGAEYGV